MPISVGDFTERRTVEIPLNVEGTLKKVSFRYDDEAVVKAEFSFDGQNWISVLEARAVIQAFIDKHTLDFEQ